MLVWHTTASGNLVVDRTIERLFPPLFERWIVTERYLF
jgi:hypothetical protein